MCIACMYGDRYADRQTIHIFLGRQIEREVERERERKCMCERESGR